MNPNDELNFLEFLEQQEPIGSDCIYCIEGDKIYLYSVTLYNGDSDEFIKKHSGTLFKDFESKLNRFSRSTPLVLMEGQTFESVIEKLIPEEEYGR